MIRSSRPDTRNPMLRLEAVRRLQELLAGQSAEFQGAFVNCLTDIATDAQAQAKKSWAKHKAPMAAYWKAKAVDVRHFRLALRSV